MCAGVRRDLFNTVARVLACDPQYASQIGTVDVLLESTSADAGLLVKLPLRALLLTIPLQVPKPLLDLPPDHPSWQHLFMLGRLCGFAVFHNQMLQIPFSPVVFALFTSTPLTAGHVRALSPDGRCDHVGVSLECLARQCW